MRYMLLLSPLVVLSIIVTWWSCQAFEKVKTQSLLTVVLFGFVYLFLPFAAVNTVAFCDQWSFFFFFMHKCLSQTEGALSCLRYEGHRLLEKSLFFRSSPGLTLPASVILHPTWLMLPEGDGMLSKSLLRMRSVVLKLFCHPKALHYFLFSQRQSFERFWSANCIYFFPLFY